MTNCVPTSRTVPTGGCHAELGASAPTLGVEIEHAADELRGIDAGEHDLAARPNAQRAAAREPQRDLPGPRRQPVAGRHGAGDRETHPGGVIDGALNTLDARDNGRRRTRPESASHPNRDRKHARTPQPRTRRARRHLRGPVTASHSAITARRISSVSAAGGRGRGFACANSSFKLRSDLCCASRSLLMAFPQPFSGRPSRVAPELARERAVDLLKRSLRARQQRLRRLEADTELGGDLVDAESIDVLPLERVAVVRRQLIERYLNQPRGLQPSELVLGLVGLRRRNRFDGRANVRRVFRQHDVLPLAGDALAMVGDLMAADRAKPCEKGGFAPVRAELANGLRQRHLHDLLRRVRVIVETRPSKAVEPRKIAVEERVESLAIVRQQALDEASVFELVGHSESRLAAEFRRVPETVAPGKSVRR